MTCNTLLSRMRLGKSKNVILEALMVLTLGLCLAWAANLFSPRGLSLTRNYFPTTPAAPKSAPLATNGAAHVPPTTPSAAGTSSPPAQAVAAGASNALGSEVVQRLHEKGLQVVSGQEALAAFRDPLYQQELLVFVDARDERHYEAGHIPAAYQFDRYYPDKYLPTVLPVCLNAIRVVVYCTGGACEDSEFAALALIEAGVPRERVFIFAGGITEWTAQHWPVEAGGRGGVGAGLNQPPPTP